LGELATEQLDGDRPTYYRVAGFIDFAHRARCDPAFDLVAADRSRRFHYLPISGFQELDFSMNWAEFSICREKTRRLLPTIIQRWRARVTLPGRTDGRDKKIAVEAAKAARSG
jgi:hypothetical protein